eukprot:m.88183 g.88183  ORF g.88183 m.88183 type:complete len:1452 (-) comp8801_c1_seq2:61-4416(-)
MCRLTAYVGPPIKPSHLVTRPSRSIIKQSYAARERVTDRGYLNGDGFGLGWYPLETTKGGRSIQRADPCVFASTGPAWNNDNLRQLAESIESSIIFAHVRAASEGSAVIQSNLHPFQFGKYMFMHNGMVGDFEQIRRLVLPTLEPAAFDFAVARGSSDSALCFAMFVNELLCADFDELVAECEDTVVEVMGACELSFNKSATHNDTKATRSNTNRFCIPLGADRLRQFLMNVIIKLETIAEENNLMNASMLNFVLTDGVNTVSTRYIRDPLNQTSGPATLYFAEGSNYTCVNEAEGLYRMGRTGLDESVVIVASEPLTNATYDWVSVPTNHAVVITSTLDVVIAPIHDDKFVPTHLTHSNNLLPCGNEFSPSVADCLRNLGKHWTQSQSPFPHHRVATLKTFQHHITHTSHVLSVCVLDDDHVLTGCSNGELVLWETVKWEELAFIQGHASNILDLVAVSHPEGIIILSSSSDCTISSWLFRSAAKDSETSARSFHFLKSLSFIGLGDLLSLCVVGNDVFCGFQDTNVRVFPLAALLPKKVKEPFSMVNTISPTMEQETLADKEPPLLIKIPSSCGGTTCSRTNTSSIELAPSEATALATDVNAQVHRTRNLFSAVDPILIGRTPSPMTLTSANVDAVGLETLRQYSYDDELDTRRTSSHWQPLSSLSFDHHHHQHNHQRHSEFSEETKECSVFEEPERKEENAIEDGLAFGVDIISGGHASDSPWDASPGHMVISHLMELPGTKNLGNAHTNHFSMVHALATHGDTLISGGGDGLIKFWDIKALLCKGTVTAHSSVVCALYVCLQSDCVISASKDHTVRSWDLQSMCSSGLVLRFDAELCSLEPLNKYLCCGCSDGTVQLVVPQSLQRVYTFRAWQTPRCVSNIVIDAHNVGRVYLTVEEVLSVVDVQEFVVEDQVNVESNAILKVDDSVGEHVNEEKECNVTDISEDSDSTIDQPGLSNLITPSITPSTIIDKALARRIGIRGAKSTESIIREILQEFVAIPSVSSQPWHSADCFKAAKFLHALLTSCGCDSIHMLETEVGKNPLVLGRMFVSNDAPTILVYGHYDVVAVVKDEWEGDPFSMRAHGGYWYGRGVTDDKGPIVATLLAANELKADRSLGVNMVFVYEGEAEHRSGGFTKGLEKIRESQTLAQIWGTAIDYIFISNNFWIDDETPCVTYAMRGHISLSVSVEGPTHNVHAGVDGGAVIEPTLDLCSILASLTTGDGRVCVPGFYSGVSDPSEDEKKAFANINFNADTYKKRLGVQQLSNAAERDVLKTRWAEPTLSVTDIHTSNHDQEDSILPHIATAQVSIRFVPNQHAEEIISAVKFHLKHEFGKRASGNTMKIDVVNVSPWWKGDLTSKYFECAENAIKKVWGVDPYFVCEGGTMHTTSILVDYYHAPALHLPLGQSSDSAHLPNERIRISNIVKGKEVVQQLLLSLGRTESDDSKED